MRIFLDTANVDEIRQAARMGVVSGVTTNPSLAAKEGIGTAANYREAILQITDIIDGPISVEVVSLDAEGMTEEGWGISKWHPNVVVKLPSTTAGLEAMHSLSKEAVKINQTLCFSLNQAILGSQAGSSYVSPFIGRLDDKGHDGMDLIRDIVEVFKIHEIKTEVLAASIRSPLHCIMAAKAGAQIATIPYKVLCGMMEHPLTDAGLDSFTKDWEYASKS